jgi:tetratricopeptide (TPR) repeat protein
MTKQCVLLVILSGAFCAVAAQAPCAQSYEAFYRKCFEDADSDQVIVSCTAVIARGLVEKADLATAYKNRGNAYDDKGQYSRALEDFGQAVETNPQDAEAFNSRGVTYIALESYALAVRDFDEAARLNPASPIALGNRCFAKAVLGDLEQALRDCNDALHIKPKYAGAYVPRALAYMKLKRYDAAIADYTSHLRTRPDDPYALFGRGMARYLKGDVRAGDGDMVAAASIKPDIADHMAKLGITLRDLR